MEDLVLWKPLYYISIGMFIVSVFFLPFSVKWSMITIFALITLWSRVPGFIHFIFNRLAVNDFFTFVVAAHAGGLAGGLFGVFSMVFPRIIGPNEWWPYTLRASISGFIAGFVVPLIIGAYGFSLTSFFLFEGLLYFIYYLLVMVFFREEIGLEIALIPAVIFFDFVTNYFLLKIFGNNISELITHGFNSAWPFFIFVAVILFFFVVAKNGKRIAGVLESLWSRLGGKKEENKEENFAEQLDKGESF